MISPERHARYARLGFSPSPAERNGVAFPDGSAYFCSALTDQGRQAREAIEVATDPQCRPVIESLGGDFDDAVGVLAPMGR